MQFPHGTCCWYWVVKNFDNDGSHESCLCKAFSISASMRKGKRSWYSVFCKLDFVMVLLVVRFRELDSLCPLYWSSDASNVDRNMFCFYVYYFVWIPFCSSLAPICNEMFHQQWYIINSRDFLQRPWWPKILTLMLFWCSNLPISFISTG